MTAGVSRSSQIHLNSSPLLLQMPCLPLTRRLLLLLLPHTSIRLRSLTPPSLIRQLHKSYSTTAIAPNFSKVIIIHTHLLMDNGSQRSFITSQLQQEMHLPIFRYDGVDISPFGLHNKQIQTFYIFKHSSCRRI